MGFWEENLRGNYHFQYIIARVCSINITYQMLIFTLITRLTYCLLSFSTVCLLFLSPISKLKSLEGSYLIQLTFKEWGFTP